MPIFFFIFSAILADLPVLSLKKYSFALLTFPDLITLMESTIGLYNAKVLSTPSPKVIFLTVNEEFKCLFFFEIHTPSKYWILSLLPSVILTPTLTMSPGKNLGNFFLDKIFLILKIFFLI